MWPEGECFILGGGPSLRDVKVEQLKNRRVIAVNNAYKLGDWIDVMFFGDCRWLDEHRNALLNFAGLKVTTCERHTSKPGIKVVRRRNTPFGIFTDPGILAWNLSSGASAINLAVHFGVKRIVLLGFDMRKNGDQWNWHNDYAPRRRSGEGPYPRFLGPFPHIARDLKQQDVECLDASPGSALDVFPQVKLEDLL